MRRSAIIAGAGLVVAALLLIVAGYLWYERPSRLTVAISSGDAEDTALITAASKLLKFGRNEVRLRIEPVESPAAASAAVDAGRADLAVVRTDVAVPNDAQTVVILHRDAALFVAPASGELRAVKDLAGHTVGIVHRGSGNEALLQTALAQYEISADAVKTVEIRADEVEQAIADKRVEAVLAIDVVSSPRLRDIVKAVAAGGGGPPVFLPIAEAEAIAQRSPAYDKFEIVRGAFAGAPPRPAEEYDTLAVTHRLVADEKVSVNLVTELTRFFLTEKQQLASVAPIARRIEAPTTDKGAPLPVHPGAAAYIDDEEQTFFDKYSDFIYIGAMLMGVLASGATALIGRINTSRAASIEDAVLRLVAMLRAVRVAPSQEALDAFQAEADALLAEALNVATASAGDDRRLHAFTLALDQVRSAVRDRRAELAGGIAVGVMPADLVRAAE